MNDLLCYGYGQIAAQIRDAEGNQMMTGDQFRRRYGPELKKLGYLFPFRKPGDRGNKRMSMWLSDLQNFIRLKYRIHEN